MQYLYHELPNGIRVVHKPAASYVAHLGFTINAGSRDEEEHEQGLAHFIEHLIFKGTHKRKAFQILGHMENVGGEINAYTSKEDTCIYGSFMNQHYARCMDLISDIVFNSVFPEKEIKKEKDVVIDEINSYKDNPGEQILDDFDAIIFKGHPLGANILGTPKHLKKFDKESIYRFINNNYATNKMVISSVGSIEFNKIIALANRYFGHIPARDKVNTRIPFGSYKPESVTIKRRNHQIHCVIGNEAFHADHKNKTALVLLNNILGGPGLNSRLNMAIREKHGFCYNIESQYQPYSDTGIFSIYFGTDHDHLDKTLGLVEKELDRLREKRLGRLQLKRSKQQLMGQVAISFESNLHEMLSMGKSLLVFNKIDTIQQINEKIEQVTASELIEVANQVIDPTKLSRLIFK